MAEYLKSFIIGSSLPVYLHFYLKVMSIDNNIKNFSYENYTIVAPLYLGLMNTLSLFIGNQLGWNVRKRLFYTSIISAIIVCIFARLTNSYNIEGKEWLIYYIQIMIRHLLTYNIIIYLLEQLLS